MGELSGMVDVAKSGWESAKHLPHDIEQAGDSAWAHAVAAAKQAGRQLADPNSLTSHLGHTGLDTVGIVPVVGTVAQGVNAGWYAAQGDYANAAFSGAAAIPVVGDAADAARLTKDGADIARDAESVVQDVRGAENLAKDASADEAVAPGTSTTTPPDPVRTGGGGGRAEGPPKAPDNPEDVYPTGLAYRRDLPQHLAGSPPTVSRGALKGTHNLENAKSALESRGAHQVPALETGKPGYTITPTGTDGISEIYYQMRTATTGRIKQFGKTVYDPAVHSDQSMLQLALKAGEEAFRRYQADPSTVRFEINQGGLNFRVHIKVDKRTGAAYVANAYPIR